MKDIESQEIALYDSEPSNNLNSLQNSQQTNEIEENWQDYLVDKLRYFILFFIGFLFSWVIGNIFRIIQQNSDNCPSSSSRNTLCDCSFDCYDPIDLLITIFCGIVIIAFIYVWLVMYMLCCLSIFQLGTSFEDR